ncbi:MAG: phenylacetate--CoA ligase [Spirochaetes bacterium]|nr:MAG: phenylacetate--CoA ligase [Spirochaetota bacterium]
MIYERENETRSREDMEQLQIERLQTTMHRVYRNVAFYRHSFDSCGVNIERIKSINDLAFLPFTTREDLLKSYPYDMFAVPLRDIVRIHSTSGTTGKPIIVGYTRNDINIWTSLVTRVLAAAGITNHDFIQIAFKYNLFTGGFGFHYGAEKIGASVIPASTEDVEKQITIMKDYKTTVLVSTPGYALHIAVVLKELNIHPEELFLRTGLFGAEPWSENLRTQIEESLHIKAYDNYGLTEIIGPGVAFECEKQCGLHINEDHFIPEIIDPETLETLPEGERGELVFTTITKQGFPLIRYRTGDISSIVSEPCQCGRTLARMERVSGRTDDMIIVEGINVFPSQIEEVLLRIEGIEPHYQITLDRKEGVDTMEIMVEVEEEFFSDETKILENLRERIEREISSHLGIGAEITLVEPKKISRSTGGKLKHVIDRRDVLSK